MLTILKLQGWEWKQHTSRIPFLILNSLNARTDDVRLNKLLHKKLMMSNLSKQCHLNGILYKMRFCCKIENFPKSAHIWCQHVLSQELRKLVPTLYVSDHKEQRY